MSLTTCKECGAQISTKADACPHCGAKRKKVTVIGCLGIIVLTFIVIGVIGTCASGPSGSTSNSPASAQVSTSTPAPAPDGPQLLLLDWNWHEESGFAIAEGQVKNVSSENLESVEAVVTYYTADKKFITTDSAIIEFNPILPGQTSAFKVMGTANPAMSSANVDFKKLMGGTISWKKKE